MPATSTWIPYLPDDVRLKKGCLVDLALGQRYELNHNAQQLLEKVDGIKRLEELCPDLNYGRFLLSLNHKGLLNFKIAWRQEMTLWLWWGAKMLGFYLPIIPKPSLRLTAPRLSLSKTFALLTGIFCKAWAPIIFPIIAVTCIFFASIGLPWGILASALIPATIILSGALHEVGHITMIPKAPNGERQFFILVSAFTPAVISVEMKPEQAFRVALFGPLITFLLASILLVISALFDGWWKLLLATEGLLFALSSFSIFPFFRDGRTVWAYFSSKIRMSR